MAYDHYLAMIREGLSESQFEAEQAKGRILSLEQAANYTRKMTRSSSQQAEVLTSREREVAVLIAQAHSNDEIAEELVLSKRTVEKHIANIRSKLGFTKRTEIVRWAIDSGIVES
jgi:non-specific serine/threonine protein kinase